MYLDDFADVYIFYFCSEFDSVQPQPTATQNYIRSLTENRFECILMTFWNCDNEIHPLDPKYSFF